MRELEFLPSWYPQMRRRRRYLVYQAWFTILLVAGAVTWVFFSEHTVQVAEASLSSLRELKDETNQELQELGEVRQVKRQLSQQAQVVDRLGPRISTGRILNELQDLMPANISLLDLTIEAQGKGKTDAAASSDVSDGQLRVVIHGVAPSDTEVGDFLAKILTTRHLSGVAMNYLRDRSDDARTLREFEITFNINPGNGEQ
jgi:Tfp pilus assembly protein PilN